MWFSWGSDNYLGGSTVSTSCLASLSSTLHIISPEHGYHHQDHEDGDEEDFVEHVDLLATELGMRGWY